MQYSGCNCLTMCLKRMCWSTRQPVRGVLISFRRQLFSLPCSQQLIHGYRIIGDVKDEILSRVVSYLRYEGGQSSFKWAAVSIALRYSPISTVWKRDQCFAICRKSKSVWRCLLHRAGRRLPMVDGPKYLVTRIKVPT